MEVTVTIEGPWTAWGNKVWRTIKWGRWYAKPKPHQYISNSASTDSKVLDRCYTSAAYRAMKGLVTRMSITVIHEDGTYDNVVYMIEKIGKSIRFVPYDRQIHGKNRW